MTNIELATHYEWSLASLIGSEHPFFVINGHTVIYTWIMLFIFGCILLLSRLVLMNKNKIARHIVLSSISMVIDTTTQALTFFSLKHCAFIGSLFWFIFLSNTLSLIPWLEEPTTDLNTTLALGIISFVYVQYYAIKHNGIIEYSKEYFSPFFLMFPINVVGKLASIISISFRLFGNIYGGSIISTLYFNAIRGSIIREAVGFMLGVNFLIMLFFGLFEGFLQAFIFTMLTVTYLSISMQGNGH